MWNKNREALFVQIAVRWLSISLQQLYIRAGMHIVSYIHKCWEEKEMLILETFNIHKSSKQDDAQGRQQTQSNGPESPMLSY